MKKEFGNDEQILDPALLKKKQEELLNEVSVDSVESVEMAASELAEAQLVADAGAIAASGTTTAAAGTAAAGISTTALVVGGVVAAGGIAAVASDSDSDDNSAELAAQEAARKAAEEKAAAEEAARKAAEEKAAAEEAARKAAEEKAAAEEAARKEAEEKAAAEEQAAAEEEAAQEEVAEEEVVEEEVVEEEVVEEEVVVDGQTIELTTEKDTIVASGATAPEGAVSSTDKDDVIVADLLTLQANDSIDAGAGNDRLDAIINQSVDAATVIANVETFNITSLGANTLNLDKVTGVTAINTKDSTGALTIEKAVNGIEYGFSGSVSNDITANYVTGALSGTSDELVANLDGARAVKLDVDAGFESLVVNVSADSSLETLTVPGVTKLTLAGTGQLSLINDLSFASIDATALSGGLVADTISDAGIPSEGITGVATGTTVALGAGSDIFKFTDASSANTTNTLRLGAGDDVLQTVLDGAGRTFIFAQDGNDVITVGSAGATDLIDGGTGQDTAVITGATSTALFRSVENVVVSAGSALTVENSEIAQSVIALAGDGVSGTVVSLTNLANGSTVTVDNTDDTEDGATSVSISYIDPQSSADIQINSAVSGAITIGEIDALTLNFAEAIDTGANDLVINDVESLVINAADDFDITNIEATNEELSALTINGSGAVTVADITNSDELSTVTISATDAIDLGNVIDAKKLTNVAATSIDGAITIDNIGSNTAADDLAGVSVAAKGEVIVGDIDAVDLGDISLNSTSDDVTLGAISATDSLGDITISAAAGKATLGVVGVTGPAGVVDVIAKTAIESGDITAEDESGLSASFTANSTVNNGSANTAFLVQNTGGDVAVELAGEALVNVDVTAAKVSGEPETGVANLTASNTGGLVATVTSAGAEGAGDISTITLGNAVAGTSNDITVDGTADKLVVTGGTGEDKLTFAATNAFGAVEIDLGAGSDSVDFTDFESTGDNATAYNGLAINLGTAKNVTNGSEITQVLAANTAVQYDADAVAADKKGKLDTAGTIISINGVESVTGSDADDLIYANAVGSTIKGGAGADTLVGDAGSDTFVFTDGADEDDIASGVQVGVDTIINYATNDVLDISAFNTVGTAVFSETAASGTPVELSAAEIIHVLDETASDFGNVVAILNAAIDTNGTVTGNTAILVDNGVDTRVYYYQDDAVATAIEAAELTHIATLNDFDSAASSFGAADFVVA